ncbi:MAG: sulfite exporter TauE/SafE family protein [Deltaproteobacteria bacterium]|nr:sulfite exporter TauE/SafE family protein [Deltaproteobacteria bacterium]
MFWIGYIIIGAVAGVLAGLLGVGGGLVIVPALTFILAAQHLPPNHIMQLALGTSLATIMFTSISSLKSHHDHGAVNWFVVRTITPGILTGTFLGAWVAAQLSTRFLTGFFIVFIFYVAVQMLLNIKPKPTRTLPGRGGMFGVGNIIGVVSSLVGIGGGSLSVPFMAWCNIPVHHAIGTSAAIGFPIALAGTAGYITSGLVVHDLPSGSLGFIYLPALAGIAVISILTAPLGARLAHRLPVSMLKKIFAFFLIGIGTKMLSGLF